jgi:hypothetical protein
MANLAVGHNLADRKRRRTFIIIGVLVCAAIAVGALYLRSAATCGSNEALGQLDAILRERFQLDSIYFNDVETTTEWPFATSNACTAQITEIKGNANVADLPWRAVRYTIVRASLSEESVVAAELGGPVAMTPERSLWQRLLARF